MTIRNWQIIIQIQYLIPITQFKISKLKSLSSKKFESCMALIIRIDGCQLHYYHNETQCSTLSTSIPDSIEASYIKTSSRVFPRIKILTPTHDVSQILKLRKYLIEI